jgi:uncharacterized membrane protein
LVLLFVVLLVRLPFIIGPVIGEDAAYHARAAVVVLNGGLLYRDVPYTYPPLYAYTEALAIAILGNTGIGWKVTSQFYDLGIMVLVYLIVNRFSNRTNGTVAAALYGFSPLPFFASSSFVSFDSTAAFWMLASIFLLTIKKPLPSSVALGIGTAYKYFPVLLLPAAIIYLVTKRQKILYSFASLATVALIQLPFALTEFNAWIDNVILYHLNRSAAGATIYNLISLDPQPWSVQSPLTILSPITLIVAFLLVAFIADGKSVLGLAKNSAFIMVMAVFFSKVVFFYALWYVPLLCLFIVSLKRRTIVLLLVPFLILQVAMIVGAYVYYLSSSNLPIALINAYVYMFASGVLLSWLLYDRLKSAKNSQARLRKI